AMEEATLLHAVERDVGVVEINHDLARRALMGLDEQIDQQCIDLRAVAIDLVILRAMPLRRVLKTIERALAGQRLAVRSQHRFQFARQHRERQVLAQLVVIEKVLVAQRQAKNPLPHQRLHPMLDKTRIAPVVAANRRVRTRPRSTCPNSSAPAFEVMSPPSKQATTARRATASNSNRFGVHSVRIAAFLNLRETVAAQ